MRQCVVAKQTNILPWSDVIVAKLVLIVIRVLVGFIGNYCCCVANKDVL